MRSRHLSVAWQGVARGGSEDLARTAWNGNLGGSFHPPGAGAAGRGRASVTLRPIADIVLWGFITRYLNSVSGSGVNFVPTLLGGGRPTTMGACIVTPSAPDCWRA